MSKFKRSKKKLTLKKISLFFLLLFSFFSQAQEKDKISVKQQDQIFFYRVGEAKDSLIVKNTSDLFLLKMSSDKKATIELRIKNATLIKTSDENLFKLAYTPGMRYRLIYPPEDKENKKDPSAAPITGYSNNAKIETDGAVTDGSKEIVIEVVNLKTEKVLLTNTFLYSEK